MATNVKVRHYTGAAYDTKKRFCSFWHQIDETMQLAPASVLEVGIGGGFVAGYLRRHGVNVMTADINPSLGPDYVASVLALPFPDRAFEMVLCCEVLEHLPYAQFARALAQLRRVADHHLVLSLPDRTKRFQFLLHLPWGGTVRWMMSCYRSRRTPRPSGMDPHVWEIGMREYPLKRITASMAEQGLQLRKTYRVFEQPGHRFFVLDTRIGPE